MTASGTGCLLSVFITINIASKFECKLSKLMISTYNKQNAVLF